MRRPYAGWVFQSLLVSFAAQLFTIPLVAFRFGTFAPYSALATLLVSPITALLIYGMPVLLLSSLPGGSWHWLFGGLPERLPALDGGMAGSGSVYRLEFLFYRAVLYCIGDLVASSFPLQGHAMESLYGDDDRLAAGFSGMSLG